MSRLSTIELTGKSGTKYSFNVYPIDEECPDESGIYLFSKRTLKPGSTSYTQDFIYLGRAQSFVKRFYNHHKDDCIDKKGANCICLMNVKDEKQREKIESDLLAGYNFPCNEVKNS